LGAGPRHRRRSLYFGASTSGKIVNVEIFAQPSSEPPAVPVSDPFATVFEGELSIIQQRRAMLGHSADPCKPTDPPSKLNLKGLALSGGGVRSATFCLGVLQALVKAKVFRDFDYLSTVSGGGYIGCSVSTSFIPRKGESSPSLDPPIYQTADGVFKNEESVIVQHLRNYSKYLAPVGRSNILTFPALIFLGFAINILLILPTLIVLSFVIVATSFIGKIPHPTVLTLAIFSLWSAIYAIIVSNTRKAESQSTERKKWLNWTIVLVGGLVLFIFLSIQNDAVDFVKSLADAKIEEAISWALGSVGALGVFFGLIGYIMNRFGRLASRVWRIGLGLSAPAALWFVVLSIVATLENPCSWNTFENALGLPIVATFRNFADSHRYVDLSYDQLCRSPPPPPPPEPDVPFKILVEARDLYTVVAFYLFLTVALSCLVLVVNVNATSLHTFYRDRLRDAYFIGRERDQLRLSDLSTMAPYHILNAAINIQSSSQNLRGRDAQVFFFSKLFCGSKITGWVPTSVLESADPQIDLAAAMAISGAAVAPNQGVNRPLRFLMAIANARLGYWLINPTRLLDKVSVSRKVSPYFFLLELRGKLDETRKRVFVSDGGHIENLGVYELLRRRCKFVVIVDAEQDSSGSFHGLAHLMRIVKIDFNFDLDLGLADMRLNQLGISKAHAALGFVRYSPSEIGSVLYIKASLTGDENEYINEYRKRSSAFPHESTSDQFFSEEQFEAYRALGFHIGEKLTQGYEGSLEGMFENLQDILIIDVVNKDAYLDVQSKVFQIQLQETRVHGPNSSDIELDSTRNRLMRRKLQLMEFAVLKLDLNEGYIATGPCRNVVAVFVRWLHDDRFRQFWKRQQSAYGDELRRFVENALSKLEGETAFGARRTRPGRGVATAIEG
jgi:hypothetical protein